MRSINGIYTLKCLVHLVVLFSVGLLSHAVMARSVEDAFAGFCVSCHGKIGQGGMGPSLIDSIWRNGASAEDLHRVISQGVPKAGMPAFNKTLSDSEIRSLVVYIRELGAKANEPEIVDVDLDASFNAVGHEFKLTIVAQIPGLLWGMDFIDEENLVVTERSGGLWRVSGGATKLIQGTPHVWAQRQGGLMDVQLAPDFKQSGLVYLSYSDVVGERGMTVIEQGKIAGDKWHDAKRLYVANDAFYSPMQHHYGSRILVDPPYLYFSVGDRGEQDLAQERGDPRGKIHRIMLDGSIPKDNPFASQKEFEQTIWSLGHRNPQGLTVHPQSGQVWSAEHGPRGGDELNVINKGLNYGWPKITYGMNYNGTPITALTSAVGFESPVHYWVPSIAVSDIEFYQGKLFKQWNNKLLVASLAKQQLRLVSFGEKNIVISDDVLLNGVGRMRDVAVSPDGFPYLLLNRDSRGYIVKLEPTPKKN